MSGQEGEWTPEFEGQRPPFEPGNQVGVQFQPGNEMAVSRHGAYSPRVIDPLAETFVNLVLSDPTVSYLHAKAFSPALWAWARAEARAQLIVEYLEKVTSDGIGDLDSKRVRAAQGLRERVEAHAAMCRQRLGLDPLSRARLGKDVAQGRSASSMAQLFEQQEKAERAREQREAGS